MLVRGMDWIAVLPDIWPTEYLAILKTGYRISGWISSGCQIPDMQPDTRYFKACLLLDRVTQIIETSQIFKEE